MRKMLAIALIVLIGLFMFSVPPVMSQGETGECFGNFDCDQDVDAEDVTAFLSSFGRGTYDRPCPLCQDSPCPCSSSTTCEGVLSPLGRWCDNLNGTVTDMTTGLVWLKNAGWGGELMCWATCGVGDDAVTRAARLWDGSPWSEHSGLSDGSVHGDWRLPTKNELEAIIEGDEYIRSSQDYYFYNVQSNYYWTLTSDGFALYSAWAVHMGSGNSDYFQKDFISGYVWPVRGGH